ncbi:hypothetical protein CspeluHIS016_0401940 [Cutaneotrichosporon spelunceum]|uniref:N-acetyltransferase domain-containing protein n=1 Tax=Cutaneotrichosporon spelunceum TaxID=1672016 RepID=A0AAD3TV02_9TREE|nr:hypothetical protein CspeluHIS016_0401940 [Cutaneotrichosporon spelunceum]
MPYINNYKAPSVDVETNCHLETKPEDYDFNFMFDVKPLRSDRVELRPFVPSLHAQPLLDGVKANPEIVHWLGLPSDWNSLDDICRWSESNGRRNPAMLRMAIFSAPLDRLDASVEDYVFAGTASFLESNYDNMMSEIGWICILKPFQRTHVNTHMVGLMMHQVLDRPEEGGWGLRRCQWKTNSLNKPSQSAALRLGYKYEGTLRAFVVLPPNREGAEKGRPGVRRADCMQRDTWMASVTWQDWEGGVREHVDKLMTRR